MAQQHGSHGGDAEIVPGLPREPVDRIVAPLARFLHVQAASGIVLLLAAAIALALANSPWGESFLALWKTPVTAGVGDFELRHSLKHWINDGLMAVFFFVIGLEVKRELVLGELRDPRRAVLPVAAAIGGMVVPAGLYLLLQAGGAGERGWGIPMATDIAFVVGGLALLGSRVPPPLRVMLLSLAIVDDIGAILVIAVGYTETLHLAWLGLGLAGITAIAGLARVGVRSVGVYVLAGGLVWLAFHESGVHATIAGVILGLMTPAYGRVSPGLAEEAFRRASDFLSGGHKPATTAMRRLETTARETLSPLERLEARLHPWVSFGIMPVFALANAGVPFELADFASPVALAVSVGLLVGKPVGILVFSGLAVALGWARLPEGIDWLTLLGAGLLAGIGFTMALFIAGLALDGDTLDAAKVGILGASTVAGAAGMALLAWRLPAPPAPADGRSQRPT